MKMPGAIDNLKRLASAVGLNGAPGRSGRRQRAVAALNDCAKKGRQLHQQMPQQIIDITAPTKMPR